MTHPDILAAVAAAHREDLLRAGAVGSRYDVWRRGGRVVQPRRSGRARIAAWLDRQLRRPTAPAAATPTAGAPVSAARCAG